MKAPCATQQTRESFVKAEGAQKKESTRCNVAEAKTTHTGSQESNKRTRQNNDFFKANYYAPFLNHAAMLHRDRRAEFKKHSRVIHTGNPYSTLRFS